MRTTTQPSTPAPATPAPRGARRGVRAVAAALGAVTLVAALAACEGELTIGDGRSGPRTTVTRDVTAVGTVDIGTSGTLRLVVGDEPSLTITAGERVIDEITAVVHGDTLAIDLPGRWVNAGPIDYELVMPALASIEVRGSADVTGEIGPDGGTTTVSVEGSGDVEVTGAAGADSVVVSIAGSGDVELPDVAARATTVRVEGSGEVQLAGTTADLEIVVAGSGGVDAADLVADDVRVEVEGSGTSHVHARRTLEAFVSGSGDVRYAGDPDVTEHVEGSGRVSRS